MSGRDLTVLVFGPEKHHERSYGDLFARLGEAKPVFSLVDAETPVGDLLACEPRVALLHTEGDPAWASAAAQLRRAGVPVLVVVDGSLEWSYLWSAEASSRDWLPFFKPLLSSHLCVIGRHQARILAALGLGEQIHVVGLPRTDPTPRTRTVDASAPQRIVVATAMHYGHELEQKLSVRQGLRDLKSFFDAHPHIEPVWRIDGDLSAEIGVTGDDLSRPIAQSLDTASGLVSFPSTVLLDGMLKGVPTAQIDYRAVPRYVQTAWEIRSADHIEPVVQELLHPPPEKLAFQDSCLEDELEPGNASQRLADLIRRVAEEGAPPEDASEPAPVGGGLLDYRLVHPQISAFSISSRSRLQHELQCAYTCLEKVQTKNRLYASLGRSFPLRVARLLPWLPGFRAAARVLAKID